MHLAKKQFSHRFQTWNINCHNCAWSPVKIWDLREHFGRLQKFSKIRKKDTFFSSGVAHYVRTYLGWNRFQIWRGNLLKCTILNLRSIISEFFIKKSLSSENLDPLYVYRRILNMIFCPNIHLRFVPCHLLSFFKHKTIYLSTQQVLKHSSKPKNGRKFFH